MTAAQTSSMVYIRCRAFLRADSSGQNQPLFQHVRGDDRRHADGGSGRLAGRDGLLYGRHIIVYVMVFWWALIRFRGWASRTSFSSWPGKIRDR